VDSKCFRARVVLQKAIPVGKGFDAFLFVCLFFNDDKCLFATTRILHLNSLAAPFCLLFVNPPYQSVTGEKIIYLQSMYSFERLGINKPRVGLCVCVWVP
jgi:hypothetical protein